MITFIIITFIISLNIGFYLGKKSQFNNDKNFLNMAKNDEQLLDYIYNHFKLNKKIDNTK